MGLDRKRFLAYLALGIVVLAVGVRYLMSQRAADGDAQGMVVERLATPSSSSSAVVPVASASPADLVVDICGAVVRPGVYHLPAGSRIVDLVRVAGGADRTAQLSAVNLASKLVDGQQVVVPRQGQTPSVAALLPGTSGASSASGQVGGAPVNLNTASLSELDALPGVGPSTAQKIIDYRAASGGFRSVDDLKNVSGIGDAKFETLKDLVTV